MANPSAASEFVRQLLNRSPLTSSSSSTLPVPPVSVNPLVKKQMFHHRGTSTRGCLTRRMECLLLLLGRQQTAGWESGQKERQESQSECQLAGLRLQQRRLPTQWEKYTHPGMHAHQHASTRRTIHTSKHAHIFTLSRCSCSESERPLHACTWTHTYTCTDRVPWQRVFPQRRPVILRLKEFAVDYFWTEAGSFGKKRPGHFEDLTSSSHCLPKALGAAPAPATHTHTHLTHVQSHQVGH